MFFIIQTRRAGPGGADANDPNAWDQFEVYPHLWIARNRVAVMRRNRPDLGAGWVRIISCRPVPEFNVDA